MLQEEIDAIQRKKEKKAKVYSMNCMYTYDDHKTSDIVYLLRGL